MMRRQAPWAVLCLLATIALSACSGAPDATLSETRDAPRNPAIVVMGGFNSCLTDVNGASTPVGSARWNNAAGLSARFAVGAQRWVRSCYDTSGNIFFIEAKAPGVVRRATVSDPSPFFQAVKDETDDGQNPLFLLGHSHGGWLAMYTAYWLNDASDVRLLETVDPISPLNCTPSSYYTAIMSPATAPWMLAGCMEAPSDFTDAQLARISRRLPERAWIHYYQRNFLPLRSDAFRTATQPGSTLDLSPFLDVDDGVHPAWNAHTGIDELYAVWGTFENRIALDLGR
jgi:hypothetical protein